MHRVNVQELPENSGWEMRSLGEALSSLERMPQLPSVENLTSILHECRKKKNLAYAQRLHAYLCKSGLEAHGSFGNYLVPMWVEVGSMCDAQHVFNKLVDRNEHSWTSLITGYVECGESQHALNLYQKMRKDCVHPTGYTFVALLKACTRLKDEKKGREVHTEIVTKGLERDIFVGNTLVNMYAKCGTLAKAQEVFDKLPVRDAVSWNALIAAYTEHGLGREALSCFERMQQEGVSPNALTFVCSLKACGSIGAIDKGQEIHAEITGNGLLEIDIVIGSTLVDMYVKCGLPTKAQKAFDKLPVHNVVSWTALIAGYAEHGLGEEALNCFEQMQQEGVSPNAVTFVCSLKACGSIGAIEKGQEIHAEIAKMGLERDLVLASTLVDMYAKCGLPGKAQEVFDELPVRDEVSWNALIAGYAEHGSGEKALDCFEQMQMEGICPGLVTFVCSVKACGIVGAIDRGQEIHAEVARKGLERNLLVGSTLVDMYAKFGLLAKAEEAFDNLPVRDAVTWSALMTGYANHGLGEETLSCFEQMQLEGVSPDALAFVCSLKACGSLEAIGRGQEIHAEIVKKGFGRDIFVGSSLIDMYVKCGSLAKAREAFDQLHDRNEVSWNALMAGYAKQGLGEEALNCLEQLKLEGLSPNNPTFVCSLQACGSVGAIGKGQQLHDEISRLMLLEKDPVVGNALVDMYAKCGSLAKAQEVFDSLPIRNEVSWNTLITGYAHLGESENVFQMIETMRGEGIKPDEVTFLSALTVCSHAGLVDKGQKYFEAISRDHGMAPTMEHHTCMVDLLGRAGQLDKAVMMMKGMPFRPNLVVWHTLLGACQKWGNVELGRRAFEHAMQLDKKNATAYVLMSNIYADAHMQDTRRK